MRDYLQAMRSATERVKDIEPALFMNVGRKAALE